MSGMAGIVHLDGAHVDRDFVSEMCDALAFRGPDAQHIWTGPSIGFAHTLLKTTFESEHEQQPASLDGRVWITADARIDAREDLARELGLPQSVLSRPDCELILHAYAQWGERCVDHLLGDFAFAIWDLAARKLFCARDHFGVKPFYYAHLAHTLIFSNTLNCIRLHPGVSDELNELAIADFLIFDFNQDPATTTFADIQRLPAAHVLIATANGVTTRRYWSLPEGERIRYRRTRDYVEQFRSLLETATADRLRTKRVAIMMSGGLDSPSVAASVRKVSPQTEIRAHTLVYDWLIPDDERQYAAVVAKHLDIPIEFYPLDDVRPFENAAEISTPEPVNSPFSSGAEKFRPTIAEQTAVVLSGEGADPLFCISPLTSWALMRAVPVLETAINFAVYSWEMRRVPKFRLRSTIATLLGRSSKCSPEIPGWINADFACRCEIKDRVLAFWDADQQDELRPSTRRDLRSVYWATQFEREDPGYTGEVIESRHPYFDIRLVRYLLAIPELPYSMDKYLLRLALKGIVPETIRTRPKTPLTADPLWAAFQQYGASAASEVSSPLYDFINPAAIPLLIRDHSAEQLWIDLRPTSLHHWFTSKRRNYVYHKKYRAC